MGSPSITLENLILPLTLRRKSSYTTRRPHRIPWYLITIIDLNRLAGQLFTSAKTLRHSDKLHQINTQNATPWFIISHKFSLNGKRLILRWTIKSSSTSFYSMHLINSQVRSSGMYNETIELISKIAYGHFAVT